MSLFINYLGCYFVLAAGMDGLRCHPSRLGHLKKLDTQGGKGFMILWLLVL